MIEFFIIGVAACCLTIASYCDIKTREVPDWVNFSMIAIGLGIRLAISAVYLDYEPILEGILGLAAGAAIAYTMFYAGQWGGGDSKLLMGLGALIGISIHLTEIPFFFSFLINTFIIGAAYAFAWAIALAIIKRKEFTLSLRKMMNNKNIRLAHIIIIALAVIFGIVALLLTDTILRLGTLGLAILALFTFYIFLFVKSVEEACMKKYVIPTKLTEGDWIVDDVFYNGKRICGPKDLGIEQKQIDELVKLYKKKRINKVLVKEGIPFVPSFLLGYIITLIWGNLILLAL